MINFLLAASLLLSIDPLPSWNEGKTKKALIEFVQETTTHDNKNYLPVEDRIAVFDQDGTLWVEKPVYTQFLFAVDQIKALSSSHPEWKNQEPYKSLIEGNLANIQKFTTQDIEKILAQTHAGMTVEAFNESVIKWLKHSQDLRFKKPYTDLVYQPMIELIKLFKNADYKVYIVSGGGQEFIRTYAKRIYGIEPEQIIGTAGKVKYETKNGKSVLLKLPEVVFIDDKGGKPEAIQMIIGKRPVAAIGNSDGDQQMLEWSQGSAGPSLQLLVHHDDAVREYAYDKDSKVGAFSEALMQEAKDKKWHVVSMKNEWKVIFP